MKKVLYTIQLKLPNKETLLFKDLNNEKILEKVNEAVLKNYGVQLFTLKKHHLDSLKDPRRNLKKIVKQLLKLIDYKIIKGPELRKHKIKYNKTKNKNNN